jgi:sarcosine oxidase/L-pipecolate oxidase
LDIPSKVVPSPDTASADINKLFRAYYVDKEHYHKLSLEADEVWRQWDRELKEKSEEEAHALGIRDQWLLKNYGMIRLNNTEKIAVDEEQSLEAFATSGLREKLFDINNPDDIARAEQLEIRLDPLNLIGSHKSLHQLSGAYDTTADLLNASNACLWVHAELRKRGTNFINDTVVSLIKSNGKVEGVQTENGIYKAETTIVAAVPWSTSLLPELAGISEAQNGNIILVKIPDNRQDLIDKYLVENFPALAWRTGALLENSNFSGLSMFPATNGYLKFIIRQKKYSNPQVINGSIISVPVTERSSPPESRLSIDIVRQVKYFIKVFLPDLVPLGIHRTLLLWYTDTINNEFLIDRVPNKEGLIICTGGSGHGFKFLPILGKYVVDILRGEKNEYTEKFKWRDPKQFKDINGIRRIPKRLNSYHDQSLADEDDWQFTEEDLLQWFFR